MMLDQHRIRYVTENYDLLQGLRGLPADVRRDRAIRRGLAGLDRQQLRDIGIDRGAA